MKKVINTIKGFTVLELIVSLAIFAMMTALVLSKYGNFNQGILLTNLAYDVALTIRNAQSYGLNVKSTTRTGNDFSKPYGVHFNTATNDKIIFFTDTNGTNLYDAGDAIIQTTTITRGSVVSKVCVNTCTSPDPTKLDIVFKRPDPKAIINANGLVTNSSSGYITLRAIDNSTRTVLVNSTGQVSVQ